MKITGYNGDEKVFDVEQSHIDVELATGKILFDIPEDCEITHLCINFVHPLKEKLEKGDTIKLKSPWTDKVIRYYQERLEVLEESCLLNRFEEDAE
jgi:methyl coenzyme M reductase subunit D